MISHFVIMTMIWVAAPFHTESFSEAQEKAKEANKPLLVDVYASWCGPCKMMDNTTWKDERVKAFLHDDVISCKIDGGTKEGRAFMKKHGIRSIPHLMVMRADGTVMDQRVGYQSPAQFLTWVRNVVE